MLLGPDHLDSAVADGIITREQADALLGLATLPAGSDSTVVADMHEERFRLIGGFNDIFIATGVAILGAGLLFLIGMAWPSYNHAPFVRGQPPTAVVILSPLALVGATVLAVAVLWLLAEWITKRLKLTAPSIVLTAMLAAAIGMGVGGAVQAGVSTVAKAYVHNHWAPLTAGAVAACLLMAAHLWRFRLPFTLFMIPVTLWIASSYGIGDPRPRGHWPHMGQARIIRLEDWGALALGLATFVLAMRFDMRDTTRRTTDADRGFWLHLIAAPLLVTPIASLMVRHPFAANATVPGYASLVGLVGLAGLVLLLAIIALTIDRRALIVASLAYVGGALVYALSQVPGMRTAAPIVAIMILGAAIVLLGTQWLTLRRRVLARVPERWWRGRVPIA